MPSSNKFITDLSLTTFSQITITALNISILKILSNQLPEEGLGIYLIIRRLVGVAFPVVVLNLNMSLARYISFEKKKADHYFYYSFILITVVGAAIFLLISFTEDLLAEWIFGSGEFAPLLLPMLLFLYSNSFHILCVGFFRGKQNYQIMNLVEIVFWINAVIPFALFFIESSNYLDFIYTYFITYAILAFFINLFFVLKSGNLKLPAEMKSLNKEFWQFYKVEQHFFKYGASRIPSGFYIGLFFYLPIAAATTFFGLKSAAYIGILVAIIRMIQLIGMPFNIIFLPKFSSYVAEKNEQMMLKNSQIILEFLFTLPLLVGFFCSFFSEELILLWFGAKYQIVVPLLVFTGPIAGSLVVYVMLRGVLDGYSDYPYVNTITLAALVANFAGVCIAVYFSTGLWGLVIAFNIGILVLGYFSIYFLLKVQKLALLNLKNLAAIGWFLILVAGGYLYNQFVIFDSLLNALFFKVLLSLLILLTSVFLYWKLKFKWVGEFLARTGIDRPN